MKKTLCLSLAVLMLLLTSCGEEVVKKDPNEFCVVTSFYPVYVTTANIMEGAKNVRLINLTETSPGCIHGYMLTEEDMKILNAADLFVASGMSMEVFMEKSSFGLPQLEILDCGEDIGRELGDEERFNPHYWMNISNAIDQCEKIQKTLCRLDPSNAAIYERNADAYCKKLEGLIAEAVSRLKGFGENRVVAFHESFDYFADQFGISVAAVLTNPDGSELSSQKLSEVIKLMKENDIKIVLAEKNALESEALQTVKKETGCTVYVIDTLVDSTSKKNAVNAYIDATNFNLDTLEKALG